MSLYAKLKAIGAASVLALSGTFIYQHEGLPREVDGKYPTYRDSGGVITSCFGHTGPELKMGQSFTFDECLSQFYKDLRTKEKQLDRLVTVPYQSPYQKAAYLSFIYNVGAGNFESSTLRKLLNDGKHVQACEQLVRWVYVQKKDCRILNHNCYGIVIRRSKEFDWCMGNAYHPLFEADYYKDFEINRGNG